VYEKPAQCNLYPPEGEVTFYNIHVEVGGKDVTSQISWTTAYVMDICDFRAHVVNTTAIQITWNTKLDNGPEQGPIKALNTDKVTARREDAGMAYREEPPRQTAGMAYREDPPQRSEEASASSSQIAGMAYREEPPRRQPGMRYREASASSQIAGMAYREERPQAGMAYREEPPQSSQDL